MKAYLNHIEIRINGSLVASHKSLYGRKEESLDLRHYLPILAHKGRSLRFARPAQKLVPSAFIDWMESQQLTAKEMVEILEAFLEIGYQAVMQREKTSGTEPTQNESVPVQPVDLDQYNKLYAREAVR